MCDNAAKPTLDPTGINFPTDKITIAQMRQREPELFITHDILSKARANAMDALILHSWELSLAEKAFAKAMSAPDPNPMLDRQEILFALNDGYKPYGITTGLQQTRQLVKQFESEATKQAQHFKGKAR